MGKDASPLPVAVQDTAARPTHGYVRAQGDTLDVLDISRVHALIAQRRQAKKNHDFKKADALRDELRHECNVEVFDKTLIWKVIGSTGHVPLPAGQASGRPSGTPAAPLSAEAAEAKKRRKKERKAAKKAAAKVAEAPISTGFGHAMLLKMGWGGEGSGLRDGGIVRPLKALPPAERRLRQTMADTDDATADATAAKQRTTSAAGLGRTHSEDQETDDAPPTKKRRLNGKTKAKLKRRAELQQATAEQQLVAAGHEASGSGRTPDGEVKS
jgi:hypothetical protein